MSLAAYQALYARMVASAALRRQCAEQPQVITGRADLDAREQRRLLALARDPGMRVNTAIHRANRLAPLDQCLPLTLRLLGDELPALLERYWQAHPTENLQLPAESSRFEAFVRAELQAGRLGDDRIGEVLAFERVCTELRFHGPQALRERLPVQGDLPPQLRVLHFRHDPEALLGALSEGRVPALAPASGGFHLAIDARRGEPEFRLLEPALARRLLGGGGPAPTP